jgi:hypothetical protein
MSHKSIVPAALIILVGLLIRLPGLAAPPLGFHPTRQYRSAVLARSYDLSRTPGVTTAKADAARQEAAQLGPIEPPIMEHLAAWAYQLAGHENLLLPRLISVAAWTAGGFALAWLLTQLCATLTATLAGVAVMMWLPFSVVATQSFQPDPLMAALTVLAMAIAVRHDRSPTMGWLLLLSASTEAAMVVKPMSVFFLVPLVAALAIARNGWRRGPMFAGIWAVAISLPAAAYYYAMAQTRTDGLFLQLFRDPAFWHNWAAMLDRVLGLPLLLVALVGVAVATPKVRRVLLALWCGYALFGVAFAYRVSTHDYYSLPLIPVAALSMAALAEAVERLSFNGLLKRGLLIAGLAVLLAANGRAVQAAGLFRSTADLSAEAARYARIGRLVSHSSRVLSLDNGYGFPLSYHGWIAATPWPLSIDLALLRLAGQPDAVQPERRLLDSHAEFFVATLQAELDAQPELRDLLNRRFPVVERDGSPWHWRFVVYDLRQTRMSITPERLAFFALTNGAKSSRGSVALWSDETIRWRVEPPAPALFDVRPREGTGPATLEITPIVLPADVDRVVQVPIFTGANAKPAATLAVRVRAMTTRPAGAPFGFVDAPADPVTLGAAPVTFQGWALDSFDLRRVWVGYADAEGRIVPIGDATLGGMRPDVAAAFPNAQNLYNDAWVFVLQPAALSGAPRPVVIHFYAENGDGRRAEIGFRTVAGK